MSSAAPNRAEAPQEVSRSGLSYGRELEAALTDAEREALRNVAWVDRLTSLWAPVTFFGIAFGLYLIIVELKTEAHGALQPALKVFGLLMLAFYVALLGARFVLGRFGRLRRLRHQAEELLGDTGRVVDRNRGKLSNKLRGELVEQGAGLLRAIAAGEPDRVGEQLDRLHGLSEKHLADWRSGSTLEMVSGFAKALGVALLIRAIVLEPFKIPSGSMIPTLEIGDQIFVNKFIYGVRLPWVNVVPFIIVREPERGDVIVFNNPVEPDKDFVKRVVGLPGDRISLVGRVVHVNGVPQPARILDPSYVFSDQQEGGDWHSEPAQLVEESFDGKRHLTLWAPGATDTRQPAEGEWLVPPKHVFVLGDNRDNSLDSRLGLGQVARGVQYVPYGNIKGKAMVIWLSLSHRGFLHGFFGGTGLRTDRLFQPVR